MTELLPLEFETPETDRGATKQRSVDASSAIASLPGRIGTDESGKGDYFGPLVIAAAWADPATEDLLRSWGVTDSKKLSDGRARSLAAEMAKAGIPTSVVAIGPERYNDLYVKMRNLNRLLAWGHARAIENLLEKANATEIVTDQFGDESLVRKALLDKGRQVNLIQMHQGERDIVVAAASVVARSEFLKRMDQLSHTIGVELLKGAGPGVDQVAARILARGGMDLLATVAKCHFKNTQKAEKIRGSSRAR